MPLRAPTRPILNVFAGPAGFVALAMPLHSVSSLFDAAPFGVPIPRGSVTKDGYELRINKLDPGITLWDLNENRQILEGAPDSLHESGVGEAFAVTFEDPVTGSDLVTFTWDDLSEVLGPAHYPRGDAWVGWSADGIDWEWQDAAGLLGASRFIGFPHLDLAVGSGFLLAHKRGSGQEPSRWFMAKVPSG